MVGSLVVMLPGRFGGGELIVEHGDSKNTFTFQKAARGEAAQYAAFCRVYFGQVARHLLQFADGGSFGRDRYWQPRSVEISDLDKRAQSSRDCHRLAQAIIQAWPQWFHRHARSQQEDRPWLAEFAKEVPTLQAVNLLRDFLSIVAQREWLLRLDKLVVEGCRQFDAENMAAALKEFLSTTPPPTKYGHRLAEGLPTRDAAWMCKLATRGKQGRMSTARLGELCRVAVDRFREQIETQSNRSFRQSGESHETLADLLKAALAVGDEKCFEDLLHLFEANIQYP